MKSLKHICSVNTSNSLHSLLEASILGDIEDTLENGDSELEKLTTFGKRFENTHIQGIESDASMLNLPALKRLSKGLDYMNTATALIRFDKKNKVKMLCNILDHLTYEKIGMGNTHNNKNTIASDMFRNWFGIYLNRWMLENKIIGDEIKVYCPSNDICRKDEFRIVIYDPRDSTRNLQLKFEIK